MTHQKKIMVLAPGHTPQERETAKIILTHLQSKGMETYSPFVDGLEADLFAMLKNHTATGRDENRKCQIAMLLAFALDYYTLIDLADGAIVVPDGRTPDTGCVFMGAVAFASGKPVILFKNDFRTFMPLGDNAMISGLSDFKIIPKMSDLSEKMNAMCKGSLQQGSMSDPGELLPAYNREIFLLGRDVHQFLANQENDMEVRLERLISEFYGSPRASALVPAPGDPESVSLGPKPDGPSSISGKVYCSGPLFCPPEVKEMSDIAAAFEQAGLSAYLPHRDGAEAMIGIMKSFLTRTLPFFLFNKLSDRIAFSLDVFEIISCDFFVINTNGSVPDDGAVSEAGMAFAAGKPVVLYRKDNRTLFDSPYGFIHPALQIGGKLFPAVGNPGELIIQLEKQIRFLAGFGPGRRKSTGLPPYIRKHFKRGAAWSKIFKWRYKGNRRPVHPMVDWPCG